MPLDTRSRIRTPYGPVLDLPPPFRLVTLREAGDAFAHAMRIAPETGAGRLVEAFARHFMVTHVAWQENGFATVAKNYLQWLPTSPGLRRDIDENGDLLVRRMNKVDRRALVPKLAEVAWLDPDTRGPRL